MSKCAEFKFDLICEIIFDKFFPGLNLATQRYDACMCMGSNPGEPGGKKFVKNDFTNQVKFPRSKKCSLCLWEKYFIITADRRNTLNSRSELVSTCRHKIKRNTFCQDKDKRPLPKAYMYPYVYA